MENLGQSVESWGRGSDPSTRKHRYHEVMAPGWASGGWGASEPRLGVQLWPPAWRGLRWGGWGWGHNRKEGGAHRYRDRLPLWPPMTTRHSSASPEPLEMLLADDAAQVWELWGHVAIETGDGVLQGRHQPYLHLGAAQDSQPRGLPAQNSGRRPPGWPQSGARSCRPHSRVLPPAQRDGR